MPTLPVSQQLKAWRTAKKLTQREAAEQLGVPCRTLQEWEQAHRQPRGLALRALQESLT